MPLRSRKPPFLFIANKRKNFISTATFLAEIRGAFEAGEMDRIQAIALMAEDLTLTKAQSEEVKGIIVEAKDVLAIRNLKSAINSSGRAIMVNGHLDTDLSVSFAPLARHIGCEKRRVVVAKGKHALGIGRRVV